MPESTAPTRRRWLRFSLRSLLVFTVLVGLLMGWIVKERRQSVHEREIANRLAEEWWSVELRGPFELPRYPYSDDYQAWWRRLTTYILGKRIVYLASDGATVHDLTQLVGTKNLDRLAIMDPDFRDLNGIAELQSLTSLVVMNTSVRNLAPLRELSNLQELAVDNTPVDDLSPLTGIKSLTNLGVCSTRVTKQEIIALQLALPNCVIEHDFEY